MSLTRSLMFAFAVAFALVVCGSVALAEEATFDNCKVVKVEGTKLHLENAKGDKHAAEAGSAKITLDGKDVKLSDLKSGTKIKLTVQKENGNVTILKVEGTTK